MRLYGMAYLQSLTEEELQKISTQRLLGIFRKIRRFDGLPRPLFLRLKAILDTREHVVTKARERYRKWDQEFCGN